MGYLEIPSHNANNFIRIFGHITESKTFPSYIFQINGMEYILAFSDPIKFIVHLP